MAQVAALTAFVFGDAVAPAGQLVTHDQHAVELRCKRSANASIVMSLTMNRCNRRFLRCHRWLVQTGSSCHASTVRYHARNSAFHARTFSVPLGIALALRTCLRFSIAVAADSAGDL